MTAADKEKILKNIKQIDAIFAFEGFTPSQSVIDTDRAVLAGVGSYAESTRELIDYVKKHKSVEGFIYSKTIGLM